MGKKKKSSKKGSKSGLFGKKQIKQIKSDVKRANQVNSMLNF